MAIETNELIDVQTLPPFKKFIMSIGAIPTSYLDSMTYAELLAWFCNYLQNTVIPTVNNNGEAVEELQDLFVTLKNYVDTYFDNLNVQNEINNKLDAMVETGQLQAIVNNIFTGLELEINDINNKVESATSGSPAGVYATVSDLTTADPDHTKIYLVTNDGNWYYYNNSTTSWTAGGVYQSIGLTEDSIYPYYETAFIKTGMIPKTGWTQGQVIRGSDGAIITFATGCYHPVYFPVTAEEDYIFINTKLLSGEGMAISWYESDNTYISTSTVNFGSAQNQKITAPADASYCRFSCTTENFAQYPENFKQMIKLSDITNLLDYSKSTYLDLKYNIINNENVYLQNRIMYLPFSNVYGSINEGFTYINKYTISYDRTISSASYPFNTIYIDNPQVGDIIKTKVSDMSHITDIGLYPFSSQTTNTNLVYNSITDTYDVTLTESIIENYFVDGKARLCYRLSKNITTNTHVTYKATVNINNEFNNFDDIIKALDIKTETNSYKAMFLGDSITQLSGDRSWITYFNQIIPLSNIDNIAVIGAQLKDKANTILDGNPVYHGADNDENNVLCNQVQKVLNNQASYQVPDIIFIAIGTNGGITTTLNDAYSEYYNSDGSIKSLTDVNRKTDAGAFRWTNEKLHEIYSNAMIVWCTPIQADNITRNVKNIITWGDNLKLLCSIGSNYCIDTEKCGINGINEIAGSNGEDLADGLHPNTHGAKKIGTYNASEFIKFLDRVNLYK